MCSESSFIQASWGHDYAPFFPLYGDKASRSLIVTQRGHCGDIVNAPDDGENWAKGIFPHMFTSIRQFFFGPAKT